MTTSGKLALSLLLVVGSISLVLHGATALRPSLPKDMPATARFVQSGYDIRRNEPKGNWVACSAHAANGADFCRVTDNHGMVIFQGDFTPVSGREQAAIGELPVAPIDSDNLWAEVSDEGVSVPVIELANGAVLVPTDDSDLLADRWTRDPADLERHEVKY